tara:strand:+ start:141 stop:419 length:279 start_codon:yes stop_codon:yes gene_type:complete
MKRLMIPLLLMASASAGAEQMRHSMHHGYFYGLRFDTPDGENRQYAFVGLNGLLPYWLEMDSNLYVNEYGDLSLDLALEYELLLNNRLHLTP